MQLATSITFPPFRLDRANEQLWRDEEPIHLRPKTFAVLRCLLEHPGQLLTKTTLLNTVWPETVVSDAVLLGCIRDLRRALCDDPRRPQFIETVHRRGYRFIGATTPTVDAEAPRDISPQHSTTRPAELPDTDLADIPETLVGREAEIAALHHHLHAAWDGARQIVFVTGEAGLGKTTLVDAFVAAAGRLDSLWIGRGQCVEHFGAGEAYMPVLEALGQLCRAPEGQAIIDVLAQYAPTWLVQMPWLLSDTDLERLQHSLQGTTQERMLREMAQALEVLTTQRPLALVLEDLHWSDYATLDLLSMLARRQEPARLLLLGTYRPEEVLGQEHPLSVVTQELLSHSSSQALPLTFLNEAAVAAYLTARLPETPGVSELARYIHQRTDGNPLFMVNIVEDVVIQNTTDDALTTATKASQEGYASVPESLRQLLEQRFERLSPEEQRVLETGGVAGIEFAAAVVAAGLKTAVEQVEAWCEHLARRGRWLRAHGPRTWPDGTVSESYGFVHALYQEVVYNRVPASRRLRLHRQIGARLEVGYAAYAPNLAAELALHFERGRDPERAVHYYHHAAEHAMQRYAYREATAYLTKELEILNTLATTPERAQQEFYVYLALITSSTATLGYASPERQSIITRAWELSEQLGDLAQQFRIMSDIRGLHATRAELQATRAVDESMLRIAQKRQGPDFLLDAHRFMGHGLFHLGEFQTARRHLEVARATQASQSPHTPRLLSSGGQDPLMYALAFLAYTLWLVGYPDQAVVCAEEAVLLAQRLEHPANLIFALYYTVLLHRWNGNQRLTQEYTEVSLSLASKYGFTQLVAQGTFLQGMLLTEQGRDEQGLALMRQGLEDYRSSGARIRVPMYLAELAAGYAKARQIDAGLLAVSEALTHVERTSECWYEAELYRLRGVLLLLRSDDHQHQAAAACFHRALDIARRQQAKSLELRAATSLARLWQSQKQHWSAYDLLAPVYAWFTEGFDTQDLKDAKALLQELEGDLQTGQGG